MAGDTATHFLRLRVHGRHYGKEKSAYVPTYATAVQGTATGTGTAFPTACSEYASARKEVATRPQRPNARTCTERAANAHGDRDLV